MLSMLKGEISTIVIAHKDRMCRFAFEFIQELATSVGCEVVVAVSGVVVSSAGISGKSNGYNSLLLLSSIRTTKLLQRN